MGEDYSNLQRLAQQRSQIPNQPNPKNPQGGIGCILILIALVFFAGMSIIVYFWIYPEFISKSSSDNTEENSTKNRKGGKEKRVSKNSSLSGTLMNAIIVSDENGNNKLWVMTYKYKDSRYIVNTYIYDPYEKIILKNFENEYKNYPAQTKLLYLNNEVWKINIESSGVEAGIFVYDPLSGAEKLTTEAFLSKYPELQGGIGRMYIFDKPPRLDFETKDGKKPVFDIENSKIYNNYSEFRKSFSKDNNTISIFGLGYEKSGEELRKKLFLVTGPKSNLWERNISESYFSNPSTLKFFTKSEAKPLLGDKVFLEGEMLYQDDECCFVFSQNRVGSNAERLLTGVEKDGNILWTASTEDNLFKKLKATDKDASSGMFFIQHSVHILRSGDIVLFTYDRFGFIGFDYKTGKKVFEEELSQ